MSRKITGHTAITAANLATDDVMEWVDISDTTDAASGTNKKMTSAELQKLTTVTPVQNIAYAASITPNANNGANVIVGTLTGDITINAFTNATAGEEGYIDLTADATDRLLTLSGYIVPGGVKTFTVLASTKATVHWKYNGVDFKAEINGSYS